MTAVSLQCKVKNHHPEWSNVFNTTFIRWTTHNPKGLSAKDVDLAAVCDSLAKDFGEVEDSAATSCEMKGLADRVATSAGDCCTPKR
jgi:4a-hydroxytetrahydrobiopterin dehydratase